MIDEQEKSLCTGCKMCGDICPKKAIRFSTTEQGFWYPEVDKKKCVKCGLCVKHCPVIGSGKNYHTSRTAYAAWSTEDKIRRASTSGGLYYEFSRYVLEMGGYLVGCVYADDYCSAHHIASKDPEDLQRIMGSKYFQSDTEGIYEQTKQLLQEGNTVLFTGLPCQVAALKEFLGRDYDSLITVDLLCRGVPSPALQKKKIELYAKESGSEVTYYSDKTKPYGWTDFGETIRFKNGKKRFISRWADEINNCFIEKNLNLRESCYSCGFKDGNNAADITIGDFWGIDGVTEKDRLFGVSALITNTEKGEKFIGSLGQRIYKQVRAVKSVGEGNPAYIKAAVRPAERDQFFDTVMSKGLKPAVRRFTKHSLRAGARKYGLVLRSVVKANMPSPRAFAHMDLVQFIKYNYFCPQIEREKGAFLLPYRGTYIRIDKTAKIHLSANLALNYYPCYVRGNQMTRFQVGQDAELRVKNRMEIAYGNTLVLNKGAVMESGYFYTGVGANIICNYRMLFGNNIMIGRDVCVFDSDYHTIMNAASEKINPDREVAIGDNCWIGARSMVLKGSKIGEGAIVSANSLVMGTVEEGRVFVNSRETKSVGGRITWSR